MKNIVVSVLMLLLVDLAWSQTALNQTQDLGKIKVWEMKSSAGTILGKAYSIEQGASCSLAFTPKSADISGARLVVTGTYTSPAGKVAGTAYNNCVATGDTTDSFQLKFNSYLNFDEGIYFSSRNQHGCSAIPVYKLIEDGNVLTQVVNGRTKNSTFWRFFVKKVWTKTHTNGSIETGSDLLVIDFEKNTTLTQACNYILGLERNEFYAKYNFTLTSTIEGACLLDTGTFRPLLVNGTQVHGSFPANNTNVIIVR